MQELGNKLWLALVNKIFTHVETQIFGRKNVDCEQFLESILFKFTERYELKILVAQDQKDQLIVPSCLPFIFERNIITPLLEIHEIGKSNDKFNMLKIIKEKLLKIIQMIIR